MSRWSRRKTDTSALSHTENRSFCSFVSREEGTFPAELSFKIEFCHDPNATCEVLDDYYIPKDNSESEPAQNTFIKPVILTDAP